MLTRIEIDGFKTFRDFALDLQPFTAIVGPNASGKSNLFDALKFLSLLAQFDIRTAMQGLRGDPEELFRKTPQGVAETMTFAVEMLLDPGGIDAFGSSYATPSRRVRYELKLALVRHDAVASRGIFVRHEHCAAISRKEDAYFRTGWKSPFGYGARAAPFLKISDNGDAIEIRQNGPGRHGNPLRLSLKEASRTALSTITTSEFPHLYGVKDALTNIRFLEINPLAARAANDRFAGGALQADASNLAAALADLKAKTGSAKRPDGVLADIAADLAALIPSVKRLTVNDDPSDRRFSFSLDFQGDLAFSSRVISDGTLRLLAVLTMLNDPDRRGTLCFEEPENGVHERRVPKLIEFLRDATTLPDDQKQRLFQILINTHSVSVMEELKDREIIAADVVTRADPSTGTSSACTRMRTDVGKSRTDLFDEQKHLTRAEVARLLRNTVDAG